MHPNIKKGNRIHKEHFDAIRYNGMTAHGWEVAAINQSLSKALGFSPSISRRRPDWVLIHRGRKKAIIIDVTAKYRPAHYRKGQLYVEELETILNDPDYDISYLEDYWEHATIH